MMKWMVRLLPLCTLILVFFLASCSGEENPEYPEYSGIFHNENLGVQLSVGMTKDEVDALLTPTGNEMPEKPEEVCKSWPVVYGESEDRIHVMYNWETDIADQISIEGVDGSETSNWTLDERISLGSTKEDIEKTYGTCSQGSDDSLSYNYDSAGKKTHGENTAVILNFCLDSEGRVFNVLAIQ